jgi:hypothetical protein
MQYFEYLQTNGGIEMNELNKKIRTMELDLLDRKNRENEMQKELEVLRLREKNKLDPINKEFSNEMKRDLYIDNLDEIITKTANFKAFQYNTKVIEIELRFNLRLFEITIATFTRGLDVIKLLEESG